MSNSLATCTILARESLAILENKLAAAATFNRNWQDEYDKNQNRGYSPGATIQIKKPPRYTFRAGRVAVPQSTVETTVPLTLVQGGIDFNFNTFERKLSVQQLDQKIYAAAMTAFNEVDRQCCDAIRLNTFNILGTPGTPPNTQALALNAVASIQQRMQELGMPLNDGMSNLIMSPALNSSLIQGYAGLFNNQVDISKQYKSGIMTNALGITPMIDQNVVSHTNGTQAVAGTNVNGAGQTGSNITVAALTGTITRGTRITLPGVFAVNPQSRASTGTLAQFVITADLLAGATSLPISPAIVTSGAFQNASASPTTAAAFTIFGTASGSYTCSFGMHADAYTLAIVKPMSPPKQGVIDIGEATSDDGNISLRVITFYDGINDNLITRMDFLYGMTATYPELSCIYAL